MDLRKFPLDRQTCPLQIGSFGYDAGDIIYKYESYQNKLSSYFYTYPVNIF